MVFTMDFFCTTFLTQLLHFLFSCCIVKDYSHKNSEKLDFFPSVTQTSMFQGVFQFHISMK